MKYTSYKEGEPVDVLFLGNSHSENAILPEKVASDLSSYYGVDVNVQNASITGMRIEQLYYFFADLVAEYKPGLVVIDSFVFCPIADEHREQVIRWTFDDLPLTYNKMQGINLLVAEDDRPSYYFPIFKHHQRWRDLSEQDFTKISDSEKRKSAGRVDADVSTNVCEDPGDGYFNQNTRKISGIEELTPTEDETLKKLLDLLDREDIQCAFISIPYKQQMGLNSISQLKINNNIKENYLDGSIPFLDMNRIWKKMNFGYKDLRDEGHVNVKGANKVTDCVVEFIEETYSLHDERFLMRE